MTLSVLPQSSKCMPGYWWRRSVLGWQPGCLSIALCSTLQGTEQVSAVQQHVLWQLCQSCFFFCKQMQPPCFFWCCKEALCETSAAWWKMNYTLPSSSAVRCWSQTKPNKAKQRIGHLPFWPTSPSSNLFCAVILLSPYRKPHPLALVCLAILVCGMSVRYVLQGLQVDLQPKLTWFSTTLKHRLEL